MSFSVVLDVAIGLALVYLLLSLICSTLKELIESKLKWRSRDLEAGIQEMLDKHTDALYQHPLVSSLFKGKYIPGQTTNLPSYIPARTFALALMDVILKADAATPSGAGGATVPPAGAPVPGAPPAAPQISPALKPLRDKVAALTNEKLKQALFPLIDASGDDIAKARENIEGWFDSSMDRVSGWYKRNTQHLLFGLGVVITILLNVDSLAVANHLFNDKSAREALVAKVPEFLEKNKDRFKSSPDETAKALDVAVGDEKKKKAKGDNSDPSSEINRVKKEVANFTEVGLPIGWTEQFKKWHLFESIEPNANGWQEALHFIVASIPGWLVTALAISVGAPFWFDVLNRFMIIRSTIKPKEKSPEEPPIG